MNKHELWELQSMQASPLNVKVALTKQRIRDWVDHYGEDGVYISFSGGKDSTVLLTIAREMYQNLRAVFIDTGLEFPEIRDFVKTYDNVDWIKPKMNFKQVIEKYGYPFISKETSEAVWGARKYLTSLVELGILDHQTESESAHKWWYQKYRQVAGLGEYAKNDKEVEYSKTTLNNKESGWVEESETSQDSQGSQLLKALLNQDYEKTTNNLRVQRLMGINSRQGIDHPVTKEKVPSKTPDRSAFSCERYQFFLDAPFEIGQQCCHVMKKEPANRYKRQTGRVPITAMMASESRLRTQKWLKQGCNAFDAKRPMSMPMAFWTEQDVLLYIYQNNIPIASVYGDVIKENEIDGQYDFEDLGIFDLGVPMLKTTGYKRTGCVFCGFGAHREKEGEGRFERLKVTHPHLYEYIMKPKEEGGLNYKEVIDWINEHGKLDIKY